MFLVHISDVHFRKGDFGTPFDLNAPLRAALLRDVAMLFGRFGMPAVAIIISGDLTHAGDPDEFKYAEEWLEKLCAACGTSLSSIFIVPGNHDTVQAVSSRATINALHQNIKNKKTDVEIDAMLKWYLMDEDSGPLLYKSLQEYNNFAAQFLCDLLPPNRTIATRDLVLNDGSILRLSGLNSTFVSSKADRKGELFVDRSYVNIEKLPGVEHLIVCHHPESWLRQGTALTDHLNSVSRLQLFGHEHTNRIDNNRDFVRIFADAAHPDREVAGWEPGYNIIEVSVSGEPTARLLHIQVHVRVWQKNPPQFTAKIDRNQSESFNQTIALDPWQAPVAGVGSPDSSSDSVVRSTIDHGSQSAGAEMNSLRDISVRFFRLTASQKSLIAGNLGLIEDQDTSQPDFERYRRVLIRAKERGLIETLDRQILSVTKPPS